MDIIEGLTTALTIGCSIYTSLKVYKNINIKKTGAVEVESHTEYKDELLRNTTDYYETALSGNNSDSCMDEDYSLRNTNANGVERFDNKQTEYYNIITVDNKRYDNKIQELQRKLTSTSFIVDENKSSINALKAIVRDQQKCIEEQRSINSQLLLKLNDAKTVEKKLDEYSVDKKLFIQYHTRINKILNGLVTKISALKRVNVTKKEFKLLKRNIANTKKNIMTTQSMNKIQFDEKISNIIRKYDKIKTKRDMMSLYTMGLNSCNFSNMPIARNNCYIPEMTTRNQKDNSLSYCEMPPVEIATTPSMVKIPVPPPMPSTSTLTSSQVSVVQPVPPVPPMPPKPPALPSEILDDYGRFAVTKNLLKTVTLTPASDTPRKIKKPQCMIDASKKKAAMEKTEEEKNSSVAAVPEESITVADVPAEVPADVCTPVAEMHGNTDEFDDSGRIRPVID